MTGTETGSVQGIDWNMDRRSEWQIRDIFRVMQRMKNSDTMTGTETGSVTGTSTVTYMYWEKHWHMYRDRHWHNHVLGQALAHVQYRHCHMYCDSQWHKVWHTYWNKQRHMHREMHWLVYWDIRWHTYSYYMTSTDTFTGTGSRAHVLVQLLAYVLGQKLALVLWHALLHVLRQARTRFTVLMSGTESLTYVWDRHRRLS